MQKLFSLILFLILSANLSAQKEDYVWRTGYRGGIDFKSGSPDTFTVYKDITDMYFTNASICDSNGNLLFYTNGIKIYNSNSDVMLNGDYLNPTPWALNIRSNGEGNRYAGADIIIQRPDHPQQYYLFHQMVRTDAGIIENYSSPILYQTVVDMSLDSGRGGVTNIKNYNLYNGDTLLVGYLAAVRHANGRDWWLVTKGYHTTVFYKWLITPDTIIGPVKQSNQQTSTDIRETNRIVAGQASFSPNGDKYAVAYLYQSFYLYDFDRCTGELNYLVSKNLSSNNGGAGCAFSPSGRYLYITNILNVYQYDLYAQDILASEIIVATYDGYKDYWGLGAQTLLALARLGPDGKIYIASTNSCYFQHVIEYPDSAGLSCTVKQHSLRLADWAVSFPNLPDYKLGALEGPCDTITSSIGNVQLIIDNKIEVFPNPVVNRAITFTYSSTAEIKTISIFNVEGKEVAQYTLPQWSSVQHVKLPELAHGVYLARMLCKDQSANVKFMVE